MTDRRPPTERPDYPEREDYEPAPIVVAVKRKKTRDISLEEIQKEVKRTARGRMWNIGGIIGALLFGGGAGGIGWHHGEGAHDRVAKLESQIEQMGRDLVDARIDVAKCCPREH